jgi:hypothetical protein
MAAGVCVRWCAAAADARWFANLSSFFIRSPLNTSEKRQVVYLYIRIEKNLTFPKVTENRGHWEN